MRSRSGVLVVLVVVMFGACGREPMTITGAYGGGVVGGVVVLADGGSPSGVEVAVAGTGMRMIVGEDGAFAFANVPERVELLFHRGSMIGTLPVTADAGRVTVELGANGASASSSRRRGVSRGGERVYESEGVVLSATATELLIVDSHRQEVRFKLTAQTVIRHGNTTLTVAELTPDTRVHVKATMADDVRTAILVLVQNQSDGGEEREGEGETATANGLVIAAGASELIVRTPPHGDVTVRTDASTIIKRQGKRLAVTDIQPGDEVNCRGRWVNATTILAEQIEVRGNSGRP